MLAPIQNLLLYGLVPLLIGLVVIGALVLYWPRRGPGQPSDRIDEPGAETEATDADLGLAPTAEPARPARPPRSAEAATAVEPQPLAADLLLVDDSAVARAKLRRLFESGGYRVQLARDGVEALALLEKGRYGLMITDLEMPQLDGVALIGACQRQPSTAAMPILAITGHEDLQNRLDECHEICGIYRKPWIDDDLLGHVASLIEAPRGRVVDNALG